MTNKQLDGAVAEFCKNPFWDKLYKDAPDGAKNYLAVSFALSEIEEPTDGDYDYAQAIEKKLSGDDRKWLSKHLPNAIARAHFKKGE